MATSSSIALSLIQNRLVALIVTYCIYDTRTHHRSLRVKFDYVPKNYGQTLTSGSNFLPSKYNIIIISLMIAIICLMDMLCSQLRTNNRLLILSTFDDQTKTNKNVQKNEHKLMVSKEKNCMALTGGRRMKLLHLWANSVLLLNFFFVFRQEMCAFACACA